MRDWSAAEVAAAAGAELLRDCVAPGPDGASVDTRSLRAGELFVGIAGEREDGGRRAGEALGGDAWGVLVAPEHAQEAAAEGHGGAVLAHPDPLAGLQALAGAWRARLVAEGARVLAITGSAGKTSTKDILAALLARQVATVASPANNNTEIGLPLAILSAPTGTRALVLEMAMRGPGQIAELTAIAEPEVGVIVNIGPAHLELLGSMEAIAAAKAELIAGMRAGTSVVVPAGERRLQAHLRADLHTVTFGAGGDVRLIAGPDAHRRVRIADGRRELELRPSFSQAHNLLNLLAAVAAAEQIGIVPEGDLEVSFSALRGQRSELPGDLTLIEDCYNANPLSMAAALGELAHEPARRVAVLGDMLELGAGAEEHHRELGRLAAAAEVELLVAVGPLAAAAAEDFDGQTLVVADAAAAAEELPELLRSGDTVLLKGSRGVGLEAVGQRLRELSDGGTVPAATTGSGPA